MSYIASDFGSHAGDALVCTDDFPGAAVEGGGPVLGRGGGLEGIEDIHRFGTVVDELPSAFKVGIHFTYTVA